MAKKLLKKDIIDELSIISGMSKVQSELFFDAWHTLLIKAIQNGYRIQDVGFLDIKVTELPPRKAFVPDKVNGGGHYIDAEASKRVSIKIGDVLRKGADPTKYNIEED